MRSVIGEQLKSYRSRKLVKLSKILAGKVDMSF